MAKQMITNLNVKKEIANLMRKFQDGDSLELIAKSMFKRGIDIPSDSWSPLNRLIMLAHGTMDARGPKAWYKIGRKCQKASHFCIIAPKLWMKTDEDENGKEIKIPILTGFKPICVWPIEGTEGKDVDYKADKDFPIFIGKDVADKWELKITQGFENPDFYAYFSDTKKEIKMATDSQQTFFHELSHAADKKLRKNFKNGQDPAQEIVAEFSATVLMQMFGLKAGTKNAYEYIKVYAKQMDKDVEEAVVPLINRIGKVVDAIVSEME